MSYAFTADDVPWSTPGEEVRPLLVAVDVSDSVDAVARELADAVSLSEWSSGRIPSAIAGAAVYVGQLIVDVPRGRLLSQATIADAADCSVVPIRNCYQRLPRVARDTGDLDPAVADLVDRWIALDDKRVPRGGPR